MMPPGWEKMLFSCPQGEDVWLVHISPNVLPILMSGNLVGSCSVLHDSILLAWCHPSWIYIGRCTVDIKDDSLESWP